MSGAVQKQMEEAMKNPEVQKKMKEAMKDPKAQKQMAEAMKDPEVQKQIAERMKEPELQKQVAERMLHCETELTPLNPLGLDFSSFGTMKTSPNSRNGFYFFSSAHRTSLDALAFAVRLLDASCYMRWSSCPVQKASAFGVRVEAWSTLCFQVDPGSGATRHKIESVAHAGGVHREAR